MFDITIYVYTLVENWSLLEYSSIKLVANSLPVNINSDHATLLGLIATECFAISP